MLPLDQYSPIPLLREVDQTFEGPDDHQRDVYNRIFDQQIIEDCLSGMADFAAEFDPPMTGDGDSGFFWDNPLFSFCDAMAYYCLIRMRKPSRIVEIGSGFSTLVASAAMEKNGGGDHLH